MKLLMMLKYQNLMIKAVEITRCEDCDGPGTKILGSLDKLEKDSMVILVDDDQYL